MKKDVRRCGQCRTAQHRLNFRQIKHDGSGFVMGGSQNPGRSLYLCPDKICWQKACKNKNVLRGSLKTYFPQWKPFCERILAEMF